MRNKNCEQKNQEVKIKIITIAVQSAHINARILYNINKRETKNFGFEIICYNFVHKICYIFLYYMV